MKTGVKRNAACGLYVPTRIHLVWLAGVATACVVEPAVSEDQVAIYGGDTHAAGQFDLDRAIDIENCTATRINARYALTAAHCFQPDNSAVRGIFYTTGPGTTATVGGAVNITDVDVRPGVNPASCDDAYASGCYDDDGNLADIAVIELDATSASAELSLEGKHATLAWKRNAEGAWGDAVGRGQHSGMPNPFAVLLQVSNQVDSWYDSAEFTTEDNFLNKGDSGGPFYDGGKIMGVAHGYSYFGDDEWDIYTSVPDHLDWILLASGFSWRGQPPQANTVYFGDLIESIAGSERVCQYACEKTAACEAYNYVAGGCGLRTNVTHAGTQAGWTGALKHGARSGTSNTVVGYVRHDGVDAVVHRNSSLKLHELHRKPGVGWEANAINPGAPLVASRLSAYRRTDGYSAIVYRSTTNRIIEHALTPTGWTFNDLTTVANAPTPAGNPVAYVRHDGVNAVVYRASADGHLIELRLGTSGWITTDLTAAAGLTFGATSDPSVYVRSDRYNAVLFAAGNTIWELTQLHDGAWSAGSPSINGGSPYLATTTSRPFGYTHSDGTNAIVYRDAYNRVIELFLDGTWKWGVLAFDATSDPVAYVRTDAKEAVVFRRNSIIVELTLNNGVWDDWNLTVLTGAPSPATPLAVYHRSDRYNSILYETTANHVIEVAMKLGGSWSDHDLSVASGEL